MITATEYNFPIGIVGGYFNGPSVPAYPDYIRDYHVHFMRYLYFLCIMRAEGDYPLEMNIEELERAFDENKTKNADNCAPRIRKILIGEAPSPVPINYFYNPASPWTAEGRPGVGGVAFTGAIQTTLFPGVGFPTKLDFLIQCAREGFLLLDLFPFAIGYSRGTLAYRNACVSAFGSGPAPYPQNITNTLSYLNYCLEGTLSIGFALKTFGEIIVSNPACVFDFNAWCLANGKGLNPPGPLDILRLAPAPVPDASKFLRVCGRRGLFGPCPILLNIAGF